MFNLLKLKREESSEEHNEMDQREPSPKVEKMDNYAFFVILATLFLMPVIFLPSLEAPFQFTKTTLVLIGVSIATLFFLFARLKEGALSIPKNLTLAALWVLAVAYFISSVFSNKPSISFSGDSFGVDTFGYIAFMTLFVTLVVLLFRRREQTLYAYLSLFSAFILVWLFQGVRLLFGPDTLSFGIFNIPTSNLIGKWNDLSIFFGLATILTLVTLAGLQLSKTYKRVFYVMLFVSLFFLAVVNLNVVWYIVALFALGFVVHHFGFVRFNWANQHSRKERDNGDHDEEKNRETGAHNMQIIPALITLVVSVIFIISGTILSGDVVGEKVAATFGISQLEVRPSWKSTIAVGKDAYSESPLFGPGPNTFQKQWALYKPEALNRTFFWNTDFVSGIGNVPTSFVTSGVVGAFAWIFFIFAFVYSGVRALMFSNIDNRFSYYLTLSSFLGAVYLWVVNIFYTPNVVATTLAFFFTGLFITSLRHTGGFGERRISFAQNSKSGFVSVLSLTLVVLVVIAGAYGVGKKYIAAYEAQKAIVVLNESGDIDLAEETLVSAAGRVKSDRVYRALADISIVQLNQLLQRTDLPPEALQVEFQNTLANAIARGKEATDIDPDEYRNWITFGRVFETVVPLRIPGAYDNAKLSYNRALDLNPHNPSINLLLARLERANGDNLVARDRIIEALQKKSNYTEAVFLLTQIEIADGNTEKAIEAARAGAILAAANDPVPWFRLGLLLYNENDNIEAIAALDRAVVINGNYSNARYFLGLALDRIGERAAAIAQFEAIEARNPDNSEIKQILENLRSDRGPFIDVSAPPPEERDELPLDDDGEAIEEE